MKKIVKHNNIEGYEEYARRFSTCAKVFNVLDNKIPFESRCPYGATGEVNQRPYSTIHVNHCKNCKHYHYRDCGIETVQKENVSQYIEKVRLVIVHNRRYQNNSHDYLHHEVSNGNNDTHVPNKQTSKKTSKNTNSGPKDDYLNII